MKYNKCVAILLCFCMIFSMISPIYGEEILDLDLETSEIVVCEECGLSEGHSEECSEYKDIIYDIEDDTEIIEVCTCEFIDEVHSEECPLYEEIEDIEEEISECICGEEVEEHLEDCPLYEEIENTENIWSFEELVGIESLLELYNAIFEDESIIEDFSNEEKLELLERVEELYNDLSEPTEEDIRMKNELLNLLNSYIIVICKSCGEEDGHLEDCEFFICEECGSKEHLEDCSEYVEIVNPEVPETENICLECNGIDKHFENCSLYVEDIVVCEECFGENGSHLEDCSQYIEIEKENICPECYTENGTHLESCSQYIEEPKPEFVPAPSITCSECNGENGEHIYGCSKYRCPECGFDEHLDECSLFICSECGEHSHLEGCIYYICEECGENEHLESCSLYKCLECGEKEHTKNCSKYVDTRPIFVRLLDTDLEGVYELLTNNTDSVKELTTEQIEEVIYYVGLIADDEDLEMEVLTILYTLPNAPTPPWKTLEDGIIYFDLAAGNVTINASTYSGYIFVNGVATAITGDHLSDNEYYVYQSNGSNVEYADNGVPLYDRVRYNGNYWSAYIINNTNISSVVSNWTNAAKAVGRADTANYITVSGAGNYNVTIDNIWSTYNPSNTSRTTGSIGYSNTAGGVLTLYLKGDSRVGNIHYNGTTANGKLIFENGDSNNLPASITCASYNGSSNHYNSVIGGNDNTGDSAYGITINGGIIYAGSQRADNCTAIGAGGNGYGKIYINGGVVTAVANSSGAAIGGGIGESSSGGNALINITGGEVYAYNYGYVSSMSGSKYFIAGAGIGGGSSCKSSGNSSTNITISGGYVFASSLGGAAIGGGSSTMSSGGPATVTISGDAIVEAQSISGTDTNGKPVEAGTAIGGGTGGEAGTSNGGNITLNINGGTIYTGSIGGGRCKNSTGKIGSGTVKITSGTLHGQVVMGAGAGTNTFTMSGGKIDNSTSPYSDISQPFVFIEPNGGAVYMESGIAKISGGIIQNCEAENGGAIFLDGGDFEMSGGEISNCYADNNGGAIYVSGGDILMTSGILEDNTAMDSGGAIFVESETIDVNITMESGYIRDNVAGLYGGAVGANLLGTSKCYITIGLYDCMCNHVELHDTNECPVIANNVADISGGAFYCQSVGNTESTDIEDHILIVDLFCCNIYNNDALKYNGSNSLDEDNGYFTIYAGEIDDGFTVDGGVFRDLRPKSYKQIVRFWANYDGGPTECYEVEMTKGFTMRLPDDTYNRDGHLLSGWSKSPTSTVDYIPINGEYTVEHLGSGEYVNFYAVWDSQMSYIVYIPESVEVNEYTGIGEMEISADLNYFTKTAIISVFVNSDFKLVHKDDSSLIIPYELTTSEPGVHGAVSNGGLVATFEYNNTVAKTLTVRLKKWASELGTYLGNLTFTIDFDTGETRNLMEE